MDIVQFLHSKGYKSYVWNHKLSKLEDKPDNLYYSSMGIIATVIKKDNSTFVYGLNEQGYPPTLISPRPNSHEYYNKGGDGKTIEYLKSKSTEDIFNELYEYSLKD